MIVPAYMYRDWDNSKGAKPKHYNDNAILLKDISIFANGGATMELADGNNQIFNEYYPSASNDKSTTMSDTLGNPDNGKLRKLYDL